MLNATCGWWLLNWCVDVEHCHSRDLHESVLLCIHTRRMTGIGLVGFVSRKVQCKPSIGSFLNPSTKLTLDLFTCHFLPSAAFVHFLSPHTEIILLLLYLLRTEDQSQGSKGLYHGTISSTVLVTDNENF
jgi:hypothetical protein